MQKITVDDLWLEISNKVKTSQVVQSKTSATLAEAVVQLAVQVHDISRLEMDREC